jgi:plasmid stabilization system protein ParE
MTLADSVRSGVRLDALRDLRDLLADLLVDASPRDAAALASRLSDVLAQIAELEDGAAERKGTALDELKTRRSARAPRAASS